MKKLLHFQYNIIFKNYSGSDICISLDKNETIENLIKIYFKRNEKQNLITNNFEKTYFIYNGILLKYKNNKTPLNKYFKINLSPFIRVCRLDYNSSSKDIEFIEKIKDNVYTYVYKAKYKGKLVAIKNIKKEQLKEDLKESLCVEDISDEDFLNEIIKFNRELENMQLCHCKNSVEIYNYFDLEKEFVIIMELCDDTLFRELAKTKNGFSVGQIKNILFQLNNVFKLMNRYNIAHRDIKLNNILVKYLDENKKQFYVLLSDYGVSNQLNSMTDRYKTNAGTKIIKAPEILKAQKYNNKCDLWSLGVNIYQLYTKKPPFTGSYEMHILNDIEEKGKTVLNNIKDQKLYDLLSKLLEKDPNKRISWEVYFEHEFFK